MLKTDPGAHIRMREILGILSSKGAGGQGGLSQTYIAGVFTIANLIRLFPFCLFGRAHTHTRTHARTHTHTHARAHARTRTHTHTHLAGHSWL